MIFGWMKLKDETGNRDICSGSGSGQVVKFLLPSVPDSMKEKHWVGSSEVWWGMIYQALVFSSGFAKDSSLPNWSKHAKTHLRIWESLEVLMPLNTVIPSPGLSTSRCLHLSQIIATLAISNNLIHFKVQGGEKKNHRSQPIICGRTASYSQGRML